MRRGNSRGGSAAKASPIFPTGLTYQVRGQDTVYFSAKNPLPLDYFSFEVLKKKFGPIFKDV
jgi:hypothetical protein